MTNPGAGDGIEGTGGLRKLRFAHTKEAKGSVVASELFISGCRHNTHFGYFLLYSKGEISDLTVDQKRAFKEILKTELKARSRRE